MSSGAQIDRTDRPPVAPASLAVGPGLDVAAGAVLDVRPQGPKGCQGAIAVRWMSSGAGVLWFLPLTPREAYFASETAAGVPKGDGYLKLVFAAQYEMQFVQLSHVHGDSTAGTWELRY